MLQKMGWKDGLGLGKKNQGRTEIIQTQSRMAQSGLGNYIWSLTLIVLYIIPNNFQELHNPRLAQMIPTKMWREKPCGTDTMTRATELPNYILLLGGDITLSTQEFCDFASAEWRLLAPLSCVNSNSHSCSCVGVIREKISQFDKYTYISLRTF